MKQETLYLYNNADNTIEYLGTLDEVEAYVEEHDLEDTLGHINPFGDRDIFEGWQVEQAMGVKL